MLPMVPSLLVNFGFNGIQVTVPILGISKEALTWQMLKEKAFCELRKMFNTAPEVIPFFLQKNNIQLNNLNSALADPNRWSFCVGGALQIPEINGLCYRDASMNVVCLVYDGVFQDL